MEFFLDLAWDIESVNNDNINQHLEDWAGREFGESIAEDVANLMNEYYRLSFLRKPEFMGWSSVEPKTEVSISQFNSKANDNELLRRISLYQDLLDKVTQLKNNVDEDRLDAWFQLVEYPVKGATLMNHKFLYAQLANETNKKVSQKKFTELSKNAYEQIQQLTKFYNEEMNSGKWKHIMDMSPRKLKVFDMPKIGKPKNIKIKTPVIDNKNKQLIFIQANDYSDNKGSGNYKWKAIKGLGYSNNSITLSPFKNAYFSKDEQPYIEYAFFAFEAGLFELNIKTLPTHSNNLDHQIGVQIDENEIQYFNTNTKGRSKEWKQNVLRNSQIVKLQSVIKEKGKHSIKLYVNQTGIVIDQLSIDFAMDKPFYEIPYN